MTPNTAQNLSGIQTQCNDYGKRNVGKKSHVLEALPKYDGAQPNFQHLSIIMPIS